MNKRRKCKILGTDDDFPEAGDGRNQKSNEGCLGNAPQVQTRVDIENLHAQTSISTFRRSGIPDDELRLWNLDTPKRARTNDSIDATEHASTHHTNGKGIQKYQETKKTRPTTTTTLKTWVALELKIRTDKAQTHNDQDSDISLENDTDDELDTTVIEEEEDEEWIDYTKRSTDEAIEKVENAKIRCCTKTHDRMKWRLALRITSLPSERWLVKVAEWSRGPSSRCKT